MLCEASLYECNSQFNAALDKSAAHKEYVVCELRDDHRIGRRTTHRPLLPVQ